MLLTLPLSLQASVGIEVELFLATECPISNRYVPELRRIAQSYRGSLIAYFPEPGLSPAALASWRSKWKVPFACRLDPGGRQARRAGAKVTPEAVVWRNRQIVYRGRIDDRYISWGKSKPSPTRRDLADAIQAAIRGERTAMLETKAIGCVIEFP